MIMDRIGLIRDKLEIKYLILYTMSLLDRAYPRDQIADCVSVDGGFGYFEFCDAFAELERDGNFIAEQAEMPLYSLSADGKQAAQVLSGALPAPVLESARLAAARLSARMRREAVVRTSHEVSEDGTVHVRLAYMYGEEPVFALDLMVGTVQQAQIYEENFRRSAEKMYDGILCVLTNRYEDGEEDE